MIQNTVLSVDTSKSDLATVTLTYLDTTFTRSSGVARHHAQAVLPMIEEILKDAGIRLADVSQLSVNPGPGSFTGVRVGITIANTLALLLQRPVNSKDYTVGENAIYAKSQWDE
jgi:tRNA threonylcarbamoyladenosine biosynthesis protein TsaB